MNHYFHFTIIYLFTQIILLFSEIGNVGSKGQNDVLNIIMELFFTSKNKYIFHID